MNKKMELLVIHHAHTDIGYTDRQEKIEWHHVKYIERVIDILNSAFRDGNEQWKGFKWTCESFWCVEKFLNATTKQYIDDFTHYVKQGNICVSGNYLNCTDLLDNDVLKATLKKVKQTADNLGFDVTCGMTADVNGYGWGYPQALLDCGIENLYSGLHTHHGFYATNKKQRPFYWQTPNGKKLLVWLGEHYNIGNDLAMVEMSIGNYMVRDGLQNEKLDAFTLAQTRIQAYVDTLIEQGYEYDFIPITVSGIMTDNSPPNEKIAEFINRYNEKNGDTIHIKMVTLEELFDRVRKSDVAIETFRGDWTDWWADGVGSTPNVVKHYREAQRKYYICNQIDKERKIVDEKLMDRACYNLMFYSEHTWGFSSSISEPWHPQVNNLDQRKSLYAGLAHEDTSRCIDKICEANGETAVLINGDYKFKVMNPHNIKLKEIARVELEILFGHKHFDIIDEKTGKQVAYQLARVARGFEFNLYVELEPMETRTYRLVEKDAPKITSAGMFSEDGCDRVADFNTTYEKNKDLIITPFKLETPFLKVEFDTDNGITSVFDKTKQAELIKADREFNPFTPIYEVTPIVTDACDVRRQMGRNRKAINTKRCAGKLVNTRVLDNGDVFVRVLLSYELEGTTMCDVVLTGYKHIAKIDVDLRLNKTSVWEPENLYLSLPFTSGDKNEEIWIDKTGAVLRPRIEQLPGSCVDFYCIQNGVAFVGDSSSVLITMPDTPLISMGTIKPHPITLAGQEGVKNNDHVYSWIMNNFWETNFKASLAGFHQYSYSLMLTDDTNAEECFALAKATNCSVLSFYMFK
ncbi:MAG: glycoside hydrolase family 38 C-terminal domain-containing protein [Oscillospiraceae bacterium]